MRRVVVSGIGAVTPLGGDIKSTWKNLIKNKSGANLISKFDASDFQTKISCDIKVPEAIEDMVDEIWSEGPLTGTKNFGTYRASNCGSKSPIKTLKSVKIKTKREKIEIYFKSKSFLKQQVRSMVGCLKYLGEKKWDLKKFIKVKQLFQT